MSSQTKLIKDIMSTYESILENRNVFEAVDIYDNVDFKNIGQGNPVFDEINKSLLQDVQTAAKTAGVRVDITTAVSGHEKLPSRHPDGNAVDIAIINGKSVSPSNRADADKFVDALVSMGYSKNVKETGNSRVVLTFGFEGHDDHVHVSNTTSSASKPTTDKSTDSSAKTSDTTTSASTATSRSREFARQIGKSLLNAIGINEAKISSSFGINQSMRNGEILLPKKDNTTIKSPVDGVIAHTYNKSQCNDPLIIKVRLGGETLLLYYCGLESTQFRVGDKVKKGDILGKSNTDVRVTLTSLKGIKQSIDTDNENDNSKFSKSYSDDRYYDDSTNEYSRLLRKGYRDLKKNLFKIEPKNKIQENIDRIKSLL